ncbi:MAG: hypothetical protein ACW975_08470, partial [Candidatus Thorarchaeota archaeon]
MSTRRNNLLLAAFVGVTLFLPMIAGSTQGTPTSIISSSVVAEDGPNITTIEGMASYVDAWGGVYNIIASIQNTTHYGYAHTSTLETIVANQMQTQDGYVSSSQFAFSGLSPFPNGAVGGPIAVLQLMINPIWEVPAVLEDAALTDL